MLPQNCSRIHYPISIKTFKRKIYTEWDQKEISYNSKNDFGICCFDYLIYLEEFYSDSLLMNNFYYQFLKISYDFDKEGIFDFQNYNKETILQFIVILNKVCCFYYIQDKIKYSKFLSNFSIRIIQNHIKKYKNIINNKSNKKNHFFLYELKNNNIISTIYNNAFCNYLKSFSYNKSLKFLEYSNKNIDENDINSKLIYYNNLLIISTKNSINYNNIEYYIKILNKLILNKKKFFDNIYFNNNNYNNGGNNNGIIKNNLKKNEESYNSFKLLSFIMYNYCYALENILNQRIQAKKSYQNSYEYINKYLGKNSFEAQKFLFRLKSNESKNQIQNRDNTYYYNETEENEMINIENRRRNLTPTILRGKNTNNNINYNKNNEYDKDIELRLESIIKKIENFEEILSKKDMLNNIILKEKQINKCFTQNIDSNKFMINSEDNITNANKNNSLKSSSYEEIINNNKINEIKIKNENIKKDIVISENNNKIDDSNKIKDINRDKNPIPIKEDKNNNLSNFNNKNSNNDESKKKNDIREKITFDMMENIIEEFKKESEEKLEQQKKLKEEKEKERKLKEEKEKKEKEKESSNENKGMKIKIEKVDDKPNESQPKKVPRIKKLFQKVMGIREKEPPKTMLGELFQSLMKGPKEEKKKGMDDGGKEIKIGKEPDNNFINLDDEEDEVKDNSNNDKDIKKKEDNYGIIDENKNNNKLNSKITINLDNTEYSYNATTYYQEINSSE